MPTAPAAACLEPRCPGRAAPGGRGRCAEHRPTTGQRGYGAEHEAARRAIERSLPGACGYAGVDPRCPGGLILRSDRWVAAHLVDGDPSSPRMAAHPACNERAKRRAWGGGVDTRTGPSLGDPRAQVLAPSVRPANPVSLDIRLMALRAPVRRRVLL